MKTTGETNHRGCNVIWLTKTLSQLGAVIGQLPPRRAIFKNREHAHFLTLKLTRFVWFPIFPLFFQCVVPSRVKFPISNLRKQDAHGTMAGHGRHGGHDALRCHVYLHRDERLVRHPPRATDAEGGGFRSREIDRAEGRVGRIFDGLMVHHGPSF